MKVADEWKYEPWKLNIIQIEEARKNGVNRYTKEEIDIKEYQ